MSATRWLLTRYLMHPSDGVEQTTSTPRGVTAWTCTRCGMDWAVTLVNHGQRPA
jgi:hypothetical protein